MLICAQTGVIINQLIKKKEKFMKRILNFVVCIILMITATQTIAQGVKRTITPVFSPATITASNDTVCFGIYPGIINGTAATGSGVNVYSWENSLDSITWTVIPLAAGQNYDPGTPLVSTYYRRNVTNDCGTGYSNPVLITVWDNLTAGVPSGGISPLCFGGNGGFIITTIGSGGAPGTILQPQSSPDNITWSNLPIGDTITVGTPAVTTYYRWAFINSCSTVYGATTTITVYSVFALGGPITGANNNICNGDQGGTLTSPPPTGGAPGTTLQWEVSIDGITYVPVVGATSLTLVSGAQTQNVWYQLVYTNSCGTLTSAPIAIVVYDPVTAGVPSGGVSPLCFGGNGGVISTTAGSGGAPGTILQPQSSTDNITWSNLPIGATITTGILNVTTYYRWAFINSCSTVYGATTTITVYPVLDGGTIGSDATLCSGDIQPTIIELIPSSGGVAPYTYTWEESYDNGVTWTVILGATSSTYTPLPVVNPGFTNIDVYYRRVVMSGGSCGTAISNY
ncbi:MAG: hypothetical protein WC010_02460 [Candidatus Absconditabacterales bacterium]